MNPVPEENLPKAHAVARRPRGALSPGLRRLHPVAAAVASIIVASTSMLAQPLGTMKAHRVLLPNGWSLTPAGRQLPLGDLPLNIAVASSGHLLAVTNNGQSDQSIYLIDAERQAVLDTAIIGKAWYGLAFAADDQSLFASGGNDNWIIRYDVSRMRLIPRDTIVLGTPWPEKISIAGIAFDDRRQTLYAVTKENNSLYVVDAVHRVVEGRFELGGEGYACLLSPDRGTLYVSCWGCGKVMKFDTRAREWAGAIVVGDHPSDMCIDRSGGTLFVANASDNTVSVIDLGRGEVVEILRTALYPNAPPGSTPNSVALDDEAHTLYVANADNNCLAVFDVRTTGKSQSKGFIPTGWYPTSVRVVGDNIFVANGKGNSSFANPRGPNPALKREDGSQGTGPREKEQYIGGLFRGTLSVIPVPGERQMGIYSELTYANVPYKGNETLRDIPSPHGPIPSQAGDRSPIRYVFYVIKENRTYDQVLGDMPQGNGDTSLVLFGESVTPNEHKLAREFVLFDNFYVNGEVSADGHNWSLGAYATDYLEKTWPTGYGGRGGTYDAEGTRAIANNEVFLWDRCKTYGITYRTYGEFVDDHKANIPVLEGHFCASYTGWDQEVYDTTRFLQWKRDFDSLSSLGSVPQLSTLRFINDHTMGLRRGKATPFAQVADNDRAVGLFVEYLSQTPIWKESAVFIVEDDAQNGPDHVDAHRTTAYLAGGFVKRGYVDHTMYSTSSMLRTIELILGVPPMSQYDAAATPMWRAFNDTAIPGSFTAVGPFVSLTDTNIALNRWQRRSEELDFSREDRADDDTFNRVLWFAVKGSNVPYPSPRRAAFLKIRPTAERD